MTKVDDMKSWHQERSPEATKDEECSTERPSALDVQNDSRQEQEDIQHTSTSNFFALTPVDCADHIDSYIDAFDFALEGKDIRNIAVTGSYGSGKSSVVRTYFKKRAWRAASLDDEERREFSLHDIEPGDCYVKPLYVSLSKFEKMW